MNSRINFLDTTKGLLMLFLVWGHLIIFARDFGIKTQFYPIIQYSVPYYRAFFMQTFFVITGFCTSWNISFWIFLKKNLKTIVLPAFVFLPFSWCTLFFIGAECTLASFINKILNYLLYGLPWFLSSLFISKILFWMINNTVYSILLKWAIIVFFFIVGLSISTSTNIPNTWKYQHSLVMLPFLALGNLLKRIENRKFEISICKIKLCNKILDDKWLILLSLPYFGLILLWQILGLSVGFPAVDSYISINYITAPFHIVFAISGTAFIFIIAKFLEKIKFLSILGRQSLFIYLIHGFIVCALMWIITHLFNVSDSFESGMIFYLSVYLFSILLLLAGCKLMENKFFSWMVGKF